MNNAAAKQTKTKTKRETFKSLLITNSGNWSLRLSTMDRQLCGSERAAVEGIDKRRQADLVAVSLDEAEVAQSYSILMSRCTNPRRFAPITLYLALALTLGGARPYGSFQTAQESKVILSTDFVNFLNREGIEIALSACPAGTLTKAPGIFNKSCVNCGKGRFSSRPDSITCQKFKNCDKGTFVAFNGTLTRDRVCVPCPLGFSTSGLNKFNCQPFRCYPGEFVDRSANACKPCPRGEYTLTHNAIQCIPWTVCVPGTVTSTKGTSTRDRECALCEGIDCTLPTDCLPGFIYMGTAKKCQPCPPGTFSSSTKCVKHRACNLDEYIAVRDTSSTDRICKRCETLGFITPRRESYGPESCDKLKPLRLRPTVRFEFYISIVCSILIWRCSVGLNKSHETKKTKSEKKKSNSKMNKETADKPLKKQHEKGTTFNQRMKNVFKFRKNTSTLVKDPAPPLKPPPNFSGLVTSNFTQQRRDGDSDEEGDSRRLISL